MKYTELRIGNVFKEKYSGDLLVVSELTKNRITFDYQTNEKWQSEPIELTEEILSKCGFSKHSTNPFWFRKKQICISLIGSIELISWDMQVFKIDSKAECLHQLQNLYFSLTGEELEINL